MGGQEKKRRLQEWVRVFFAFSLSDSLLLPQERKQKKNHALYLFAIEKLVHYPRPSYPVDVFQKPKGRKVAADADGSHTVYLIDCKTVHTLIP